MDSNDDKRRELIARAISACSGSPACDLGESRILPWKQLATHLSPLIGESGFSALYRRTVRLVAAHHEWLSAPQAAATSDDLLVALRSQLGAEDPDHADAANAALLTTFTKLLSGLIGEALTIRLLHSAWMAAGGSADARDLS